MGFFIMLDVTSSAGGKAGGESGGDRSAGLSAPPHTETALPG